MTENDKDDLIKKYNSYFDQFEMFLHPQVVNGFKKIHREILKIEIEKAKSFKPSKEWLALKAEVDKIRTTYEPAVKPILIKQLLKIIDSLPDESWD